MQSQIMPRTVISSTAALVSLFILFACNLQSQANYSRKDSLVKRQLLSTLPRPDPRTYEHWTKLRRLAARHKDAEIADRMLSFYDKTDAAGTTQYDYVMYEFFTDDPVFFISSLNRYFHGHPEQFLSIWIQIGDFWKIDTLKLYTRPFQSRKSVRRFLNVADSISAIVDNNTFKH